jgi:hypothetical protein
MTSGVDRESRQELDPRANERKETDNEGKQANR